MRTMNGFMASGGPAGALHDARGVILRTNHNLSRGGLFVETDADIPTGALLTVDFNVPGAGTGSVNVDS